MLDVMQNAGANAKKISSTATLSSSSKSKSSLILNACANTQEYLLNAPKFSLNSKI